MYSFIFLFILSSSAYCGDDSSIKQLVIKKYLAQFETWATNGGDLSVLEKEIVEPCGKLVMVTASVIEKATFLTTNREELDFRVDVCVKMAVNRVYPQPEFENPEIIGMICDDHSVPLFEGLCIFHGIEKD